MSEYPENRITEDQPFELTETITVPDRDLSPAEMAKIMRQVARICNFLGSLILKHTAMSKLPNAAGAGHPICQSIITCAAQADNAAIGLSGPSQIMQAIDRPSVPIRRH